MLLLVEVTLVTSIPAVDTILAVALLVAPAATARLWTERLGATMAVAAGATIALVAAGVFAVSLLAAPATACSPAPPPPGRRRRSGGGVSGGGVRAGR